MSYSTIAVIYNPNSTGPSRKMAEDFVEKIMQQLPDQSVELIATEYAGHTEELAYELAKNNDWPLIISSSGDGGYNEVINGALKAKLEGSHPVTGLIPAGNANDHYRNLHNQDFIDAVVGVEVNKIDVLKLSGVSKGEAVERYAHSYIGVGLTSKVGRELNKNNLNSIKEIIVAGRVFFKIRSIRLRINNKVRRYDSLIFSNIDSMSKYLRISSPSRVDDGKFEITAFRPRHKLKLLGLLLKSSLFGLKEDVRASEFKFETLKKTSIQADGEIIMLDAASTVVVTAEKQFLECII